MFILVPIMQDVWLLSSSSHNTHAKISRTRTSISNIRTKFEKNGNQIIFRSSQTDVLENLYTADFFQRIKIIPEKLFWDVEEKKKEKKRKKKCVMT